MPRFAFLVLLVTSTLHAQFPATMGGLLSLLLEKPAIVRVTSLTRGPGSFKLSLRTDDGATTSFESTGANMLDMKLVSHLQEGRRYAFPQDVIDLFGYENTVAIVRSLPHPQALPLPFPTVSGGLLKLGSEHPFRAIVLDQGLGEKGYSIVLQAADSRLLHVNGTFDNELTKRIAQHLKRGQTYEFPAVLDDALLSEAERKTKSQPKSAEVRALARYIGEWTGTLESDPMAKIVMKCHWKADGTGIWREITFSRKNDDNPPSIDIALITYDASQQRYVGVDPAKKDATPFHITWNAAEQSFLTTFSSSPDETRVNTAIFSSDDRIDWQTVTQDSSGKTISSNHGGYKRIAAVASTLKRLPTSTKTTTVIPTPVAGSRSHSSTFSITRGGGPIQQPAPLTFFTQLRDLPPFRGKITALSVGEKEIIADIECMDSRRYSIRHTPGQNWDQALAIARRLTLNETFEFPDILAENYTAPAANTPPTEAMRALAPFIGEWLAHWDADAANDKASKNTNRYFWKADGTGLWRESCQPATTIENNGKKVDLPARTLGSLIRHEPGTGDYVEIMSSPNILPTRQKITWDVSTQTLAWSTTVPHPAPGTHHSGTRHFVSPDRIDFHSQRTKADGTLIDEFRGHFDRIKP